MANRNGNPQNLMPFRTGETGNPGGKPVNARNRLQGKFVNALGRRLRGTRPAAIIACREKDPGRYLAIICTLMPKQIETSRPLDELTDEELEAGISYLRLQVTAGRN